MSDHKTNKVKRTFEREVTEYDARCFRCDVRAPLLPAEFDRFADEFVAHANLRGWTAVRHTLRERPKGVDACAAFTITVHDKDLCPSCADAVQTFLKTPPKTIAPLTRQIAPPVKPAEKPDAKPSRPGPNPYANPKFEVDE